jgi:hypothetical protein
LILPGTLDNPVYTEVYTGRKKQQRNGVIAHRKCLLRKYSSYTSDSSAWLVAHPPTLFSHFSSDLALVFQMAERFNLATWSILLTGNPVLKT